MPLWPLRDASPEEGAFDRLLASIDPDWVDEALELTGTVILRRRRLPAEQVIWLVLGMALYRDRPIAELVDKLDLALPDGRDLTVTRSAVAQARARLGAEPMRWSSSAAPASGPTRRRVSIAGAGSRSTASMAPLRARLTHPRTARTSAARRRGAARAATRRCASSR